MEQTDRPDKDLPRFSIPKSDNPKEDNSTEWADQPAPDFVFEGEEVQAMEGVNQFLGLYQLDHEPIAKNISALIKSNQLNPIEAYLSLRRMEAMIKKTIDSKEGDQELRDLFKEKVAELLGNAKSVDVHGANISLRATGTFYDYSECKDTYLNELYKIQEKVGALIKARETEIKTLMPPDSNILGIQSRKIIQEGMPYFGISEDEFEETINPCIKKQGQSIVVSFKKR